MHEVQELPFPQLLALWPGCLHLVQRRAFFAEGAVRPEVEDTADGETGVEVVGIVINGLLNL